MKGFGISSVEPEDSATTILACVAQKMYTSRSAAIFDCLPFDSVAPAFMCLAPSFERISHYTVYITFRFNSMTTSVDIKC
jgi:hypothetical protein